MTVKSVINSFRYAFQGLVYAFRNERSFKIQSGVGTLVIIFALVLSISVRDLMLVILLIGAVLILELINTVLERFLTIVEPKIAHYAKIMKDLMAGAVLLASIIAVVVGALIFWPYIF